MSGGVPGSGEEYTVGGGAGGGGRLVDDDRARGDGVGREDETSHVS